MKFYSHLTNQMERTGAGARWSGDALQIWRHRLFALRSLIWSVRRNDREPLVSTKCQNLVAVLREARTFLARPDNDFAWSSWEDAEAAFREIDGLISRIESGTLPPRLDLTVLFAPTGPIQEVSVSSGWGQEFVRLADRFDAAVAVAYDTGLLARLRQLVSR